MNWTREQLWERFQKYYFEFPTLGLSLDLSRVLFPDGYFATQEADWQRASAAMKALEAGAIANPDEKRMVGHYWLRDVALAPTPELRQLISETWDAMVDFTAKVHSGEIQGAAGKFTHLLVIGIGGSALGPQFVTQALGHAANDKLKVFFFDNTDPDGMDKVLSELSGQLGRTLAIVISKSGGTQETRNGMLEAAAAYKEEGLNFAAHAVAITGLDSKLDKFAASDGWLARFQMWDWVGGRTSETSAVGVLPGMLQGLNMDGMLRGARECDKLTRSIKIEENPAALLALSWYYIVNGRGEKDMVILPYKDRLVLFSKYLQQLIMESLGKELDLEGRKVNQGIAVYGNKGSTDQHAYVQQLRDGVNNFFATFIEVLKDRAGNSMEVEPDVTSGDYLNGFYQGTRQALFENGRQSLTISIRDVSAFSVGALIALYERAVGFYATLVGINAYHQPGVEAGKKAAGEVIAVQAKVLAWLRVQGGKGTTVAEIASGINAPEQAETVFKIVEHLSANLDRGIVKTPGSGPFSALYATR